MVKINQRIGLIKIRAPHDGEEEDNILITEIGNLAHKLAVKEIYTEEEITKIIREKTNHLSVLPMYEFWLDHQVSGKVSMVAKGQLTKDGYNFSKNS